MTEEIQSIYDLPIGSQREHNGLLLTLTEDGWRAEVQHSMHRRCKGWDYCKPWTYLITIACQHHDQAPRPKAIPVKCSNSGSKSEEILTPIPATWRHPQWLLDAYSRPGRPHLFGELCGNSEQEATIALNAFGKAVEEQILSIPQYCPDLKIIEKVVMPNHIHMVIRVKRQLPKDKPLGYYLDRFKSWVNRRYKEVALGLPVNTVMFSDSRSSSIKPSGSSSIKPSGSSSPNIGLVFEEGFHDRILFREGQLKNMIDYCRDNPRRLWKVVHSSQYFHAVCGIRLAMPLLNASGTKGRHRWNGPVEGLLAPILFSDSGSPSTKHSGSSSTKPSGSPSTKPFGRPSTTTITFTALGNLSLLGVPELMQIQCSRSMAEAEIEALTVEVLEACKHGVVPISPCISPGEKAVARAVMEAGYNLIALFPQGIPEDTTYKPYKEYFDACANGQLLLMSPWKFENGRKHLARWQCLFLNDIAMQMATGMATAA